MNNDKLKYKTIEELTMQSAKYDALIVKTLGNKYLKENTVYYNDQYFDALYKQLEKENLLDTYSKELTQNSKGIKMCSIASSSRLCYLASKSILKGITDLEKKDLKNGCCKPNYDAYDSINNIFYECKCHEICSISHDKFSKSYKKLFEDIYGITKNNLDDLKFSDFNIEFEGDPSIYKINFDFKQFICHVFGLLSVKHLVKPTLRYVFFVPRVDVNNQELIDFLNLVENQIKTIIPQFSELKVNANGVKQKIKDLMNFEFRTICVDEVDDFIFNILEEK